MKNKPHDFEGTPLKLGDAIVYVPYQGGGLQKGTVAGFTPQMVRCLAKGKNPTHTYTNFQGKIRTQPNSIIRYPCDVAKIKDL